MLLMMDIDDEYQKATAERELRHFNEIVEKHCEDTNTFIEKLCDCDLPSWNINTDPLQLGFESVEKLAFGQLVNSDNKLVNKVVLALVAICREISDLVEEAENDIFLPIIVYESIANSFQGDGSPEVAISKILPILHQASNYCNRVSKVTLNAVLQLNALYPKDEKAAVIKASSAHFQVVFEHLGRLFGTLITLDELITSNSTLQNHWRLYKQSVKLSINEFNSNDFENKDLITLEKFLKEIEKNVMGGDVFKKVVSLSYDSDTATVSKNNFLRDEMATVILGWCSQVEVGSSEGWQSECERQALALISLFVFHRFIFDVEEKKISKAVLSLMKKYPCIILCGCRVWVGEKYLKTSFPSLSHSFDRKNLDHLQTNRANHLTQKVQTTIDGAYSKQVNRWSIQFFDASKKHVSKLSKQDLNSRVTLFLQGLVTAYHIKDTVTCVLFLHTALSRPMTKNCAINVCNMLEQLKSIQLSFNLQTTMIANSLPYLKQYLSYQILILLRNAKSRVCDLKDFDNQRLDTLSAFTVSECALNGGGDADRLLVARVALSLVNRKGVLTDEELSNLLVLLKRMDLISDIERKIFKATETSFLYHHRVLFPIYFEEYFKNPSSVSRIHFFLLGLEDISLILKIPNSLANRDVQMDSLSKEIENTIINELLDKICKEVETELRFITHSHLSPDHRNPFNSKINNLYSLLHLSPLFIFGKLISVKEYVEHYLERVFYGLGVVAPHDCSTYELMHHLAFTKYGLTLIPSNLPSRAIDQVVDILEIMRNIDGFVQEYQYNLNQQFFLEAKSNNKHLNVVGIKDISNSIRTHGTGIINTAVNYTYQFLRQKFHILSQFLYDEQIKSRLFKDLQCWKELKQTEKCYPYERAERFNRGMKKLGVSSEGLTYLDQFRKLVTLTGNAIGYVRLIRTARIHCSSSSIQFIPETPATPLSSPLLEGSGLSEETIESARNLDKVINGITEAFQQDTDYFQMMVRVFASVLQQPKNSHLNNFFLIVPPLMINYIEYILAAKENIGKKSPSGYAFTDDGFAMGIAYLLKVLNQSDDFDALHWWSGVKRRFIKEKQKVDDQRQIAKKSDAKLQETLALASSRLRQFEKEFELIFLVLSSAQVLFKNRESTPEPVG